MSEIFNCAYARGVIYELTKIQSPKNLAHLSKEQRDFRRTEFCSVFGKKYAGNAVSNAHYFDKCCLRLLQITARKWNPASAKLDYMAKFNTASWKKLGKQNQKQHTLQNCQGCLRNHNSDQAKVPERYLIAKKRKVPLLYPATEQLKLATGALPPTKKAKREVLKDVVNTANKIWENVEPDTSFPQAIASYVPNTGIILRPSPAEVKQKQREVLKKCTKHVANIYQQRDTDMVLQNRLALSTQDKLRIQQSFETHEDALQRTAKAHKQKSHSPSSEKQVWNKENVEKELREWPVGTKINWTRVAEKHNVPSKNKGQVVKDFAKSIGIDTKTLDGREEGQRTRRRRLRMPGGEICVPTHLNSVQIREEIHQRIAEGRYFIGEPCVESVLVRYKAEDGSVKREEITINARRIPVLEIRKRLLTKHAQMGIMRLNTDNDLLAMPREVIVGNLEAIHEPVYIPESTEHLREKLKHSQRVRHFVEWHDHSTLLGRGYILFTTQLLYDQAVFLTNEEYKMKTGKTLDIQTIVEEPAVTMIGVSSSSDADQLRFITARTKSVSEYSTPIETSTGIAITDCLRFFTADTPAKQFEAGCKRGGKRKCVLCGCLAHLHDDFAYCARQSLLSCTDRQMLVLAGRFGRTPGAVKPLSDLSSLDLRSELNSRKVPLMGTTKPQFEKQLSDILRGSVRVPALLSNAPEMVLGDLNLGNYTILPVEPLHDVKGHMVNIFKELRSPHYLDDEARRTLEDVLGAYLHKEKEKGSDYRYACIFAYNALRNTSAPKEILQILETLLEITHVLYMPSSEATRTPKLLWRISNLTWLHSELCKTVFCSPKVVSRDKFFGAYFHHLMAHIRHEIRIVPLRSTNAELTERLFNQLSEIAKSATNRQVTNIIPNLLIRLQAENEKQKSSSYASDESRIAKAAKVLPTFGPTEFKLSFIKARESSYQAHLESCSDFLLPGPGIWWRKEGTGENARIINCDGPNDPDEHPEGPKIAHFRSTTIFAESARIKDLWQTVIDSKIDLPLATVRTYDENDNLKEIVSNDDQESSAEDQTLTGLEEVNADVFQLVPTRLEESNDDNMGRYPTEASTDEVVSTTSSVSEPIIQLKTSVAKSIARILGPNQEIQNLDCYRQRAKTARDKKQGALYKYWEGKYSEIESMLTSKVLQKDTELTLQIRDEEAKILKECTYLPPPHKAPEHLMRLYSLKRTSQNLLRHWKVKL